MVKRQYILIAGVGLLVIVIIVVSLVAIPRRGQSLTSQASYTTAALAELPKHDKSNIDTSHLATNLLPPTNHWFTGAALQHDPKPIFPLPLKFAPSDTDFIWDMPKVTANSKLIQAVDNLPVRVVPQGAHNYQVTRYDETSVDLTYYAPDKQALATVTIVAGSPYIYLLSQSDVSLEISSAGSKPAHNGSTVVYGSASAVMTLAPFQGATVTNVSDTSASIRAPKGSFVTLFASANTEDAARLSANAPHRVVGTTVSARQDGQDYVTTIAYKTADQKSTWYARLPHQGGNPSGPAYDTICGRVKLEEGNSLEYHTKAVDLKPQLDLSALSADEKQLLIATLTQDVAHEDPYPADTYFGGKMLYRDAQLLTLATQLGQTSIAAQLQARIHTELSVRFTPNPSTDRSFYYDSRAHGIVGVTPAFGSESFNDHHFHYGYFLYAAAVLAQYDTGFKAQYGDQVNLLVADIANGVTDANFLKDRMYDPYFGHSWASGDSPFADGNNQESSSEAINAWVGMGLWAKEVGDTTMPARAGWLLSGETAGAGAYWLNFDSKSYPYNAGYGKQIVSLNWGAKRDYATFFSASPKAILGIQLIPMSPTASSYLGQFTSKIPGQLQEARSGQAQGQQFDDYLLMYQALQGSGTSLIEQAKVLPDAAIDNANSRTYLYAWLLSHR